MTADQRKLDQSEEPVKMELRGHVVIGRTINLAPFNSFKVEIMEEFDLDEKRFEDVMDDILERLRLQLINRGVVKE